MHVKREVMLFISMIVMSNMVDLIMCRNKRIKIYVPEYTKHVHHHHVKKVPVYIVTRDRPRVLHASHIEDDLDDSSYRKFPRTKTHPDYDDAALIQGVVYSGDESQVHEDAGVGFPYTTWRPQAAEMIKKPQKSPYTLRNSDFESQHRTPARHNRLKLYGY